MVQEAIKDYLVSLNLKVNNSQFSEFTGKLKELDNMTASITSKTAKGVASATVIVVGFLASVTGGVAAFLDGLAQSDIETEKFAKRMWMTEEAARELEIVLNAMGEDFSSLEDIAANEELRGYFFRLKNEAKELLPPKELQDKLRGIREIRFEFMRFRQLVSYAAQWVGYYLTEYLDKPLGKTKLTLRDLNNFLKDNNMHETAKKIAKGLALIVRVSANLIGIFVKLSYNIKDFWDNLSAGQKSGAKISGTIALFMILIKLIKLTTPIGKFVAVIGTLFFMISEYQRYLDGASTRFDTFFDAIHNVFGDKELGISFTEMLKSVFDLINSVTDAFDEFDKVVKELTGFTSLELALRSVKDLLITIIELITMLAKILDFIFGGLGKGIKNWKDFFKTGDPKHLFFDTDEKDESNRNKNLRDFLSNMPAYKPEKVARTSMSRSNISNYNTTDNKKVVNGGYNPIYNIYGNDATRTAREADKFNRMILNRAFS